MTRKRYRLAIKRKKRFEAGPPTCGDKEVCMPADDGAFEDVVQWTRRTFYDGTPDRIRALEREIRNCEIAQFIYDVRHELGLTKAQFANRVGIKRTEAVPLEAADYYGPIEDIVRRVEAEFNRRFEAGRDGSGTKPDSEAGGLRP